MADTGTPDVEVDIPVEEPCALAVETGMQNQVPYTLAAEAGMPVEESGNQAVEAGKLDQDYGIPSEQEDYSAQNERCDGL